MTSTIYEDVEINDPPTAEDSHKLDTGANDEPSQATSTSGGNLPPETPLPPTDYGLRTYNGLNGFRIQKDPIKTTDIAWFALVWGSLKVLLFFMWYHIYAANLPFYDPIPATIVPLFFAAASVVLPFMLFDFVILHKFGETVWTKAALVLGVGAYVFAVYLEFSNFNEHLYNIMMNGAENILEGKELAEEKATNRQLANVMSVGLTAFTALFTAIIAQKHVNLISSPVTVKN